jgi:hypothetical protein
MIAFDRIKFLDQPLQTLRDRRAGRREGRRSDKNFCGESSPHSRPLAMDLVCRQLYSCLVVRHPLR